jgi:hypothetical protein
LLACLGYLLIHERSGLRHCEYCGSLSRASRVRLPPRKYLENNPFMPNDWCPERASGKHSGIGLLKDFRRLPSAYSNQYIQNIDVANPRSLSWRICYEMDDSRPTRQSLRAPARTDVEESEMTYTKDKSRRPSPSDDSGSGRKSNRKPRASKVTNLNNIEGVTSNGHSAPHSASNGNKSRKRAGSVDDDRLLVARGHNTRAKNGIRKEVKPVSFFVATCLNV